MNKAPWEEEFDSKWVDWLYAVSPSEELKSFIKSLLSAQRTRLIEEVEGIRLEPTLCGNCNLNGKLCKECYANRRANSSLDAIIERIKEMV